MNMIWIKIGIHSVICMFILLTNYGFNVFFNEDHISFSNVFFLSAIYMVFYLLLASTFGFIWFKRGLIKVLLIGLYVVLAWNIVPIIDAVIYRLLPALGTVLYDESKPQNLQEYHFRIWRAFIIVNVLSILYVVLLTWYRKTRVNIEMDRELQQYRARVVDAAYTAHFLKNIFLSTFGRLIPMKSTSATA